MAYLLDTNVMWRRFDESDPRNADICNAIETILRSGERVYITAQNLIEYQAVATRPKDANGLGYTPSEASFQASKIESAFSFLPDSPAVYPQWRALADKHSVAGKNVHDARLVAVMLVYGVTNLLTLDPTHFHRFADISVIEPANVR